MRTKSRIELVLLALAAGVMFWLVSHRSASAGGTRALPPPAVDAPLAAAKGRETAPSYEDVSSGTTGHAESVKIVYDPSQITYGQLLQIFFSVAHDPTQFNRQGPDEGTQYRSIVFYANEEQKRIAAAYIAQLDGAKILPGKIVTQVVPLKAFYTAEEYHQNYLALHPRQPYIVYNDLPKLENLKKDFPDLYREP